LTGSLFRNIINFSLVKHSIKEDDIRGSLKEGKLADITVFDRNLLEIPEDEILKVEVLYTIIDGKILYKSNGGA